MQLSNTLATIFSLNSTPDGRDNLIVEAKRFKIAALKCEQYNKAISGVASVLLAGNTHDLLELLNIAIPSFMAIGYQIAKQEEGVCSLEDFMLNSMEENNAIIATGITIPDQSPSLPTNDAEKIPTETRSDSSWAHKQQHKE